MNPPAIVPEAPIAGSLGSGDGSKVGWADWWPVGLGLLVLYAPTYVRLAREFWGENEYAHGPLVLAVVAWLAWRSRRVFTGDAATSHPAIGGGLLAFGLACYVLGRSQDIPLLEVGSQLPVIAGSLLLVRGRAALSHLGFALFFLLFLVPLPGTIVAPLTGTLKQYVSAIAESLLYAAGVPIGRSGVVLSVGPYQLLVADACSGLHSLLSMASMGLLYIYLTSTRNGVRDGVLIASLLPIGFAANVVRVIVLVLVTYYLGDAAGQGFIHGLSGILLFVTGMLMLFALDAALFAVTGRRR